MTKMLSKYGYVAPSQEGTKSDNPERDDPVRESGLHSQISKVLAGITTDTKVQEDQISSVEQAVLNSVDLLNSNDTKVSMVSF